MPEITLKLSEINVYGGKAVTIDADKLTIGETEVATWTDDKSAADKCTVVLSFTEAGTKATTEATTQAETGTDNAPNTKAETKAGTTIKSGDSIDKSGTLTLTVTDEAGNSASKGITLTEDNSAPEIKVLKESVNVYGGKAVTAKDNTLSIGGDAVLTWTDDHGDECTLTLALDGAAVSIGDEVGNAGILKVTVSDSKGLGTEAGITLTDQVVFGMANLKNLNLEVDREVNLMDGITTAEGWSIAKVEVETVG